MNEIKPGTATITLTDPETGEQYTMEAEGLRAMVADIAKDCPELGEVPEELRNALKSGTITLEAQDVQINPDVLNALALKDAIGKVEIVEAVPAQPFAVPRAEPRGMQLLNRKQRRANEKKRRSNVFQKQEAKRREVAMKAMQAQLDADRARKEQEALNDVPLADPRHIGKIVKVFEPLEKMLATFVDGEVPCMEDGTPLMWVTEDGSYYPAVACLRSVIETYAKLGHTHGWTNKNAALTHLTNLLERGEPIHKHDVDAALKTVEWMKYCTLTITPRQFSAEAVEVQIAGEQRHAGHAPELTDADLNGHAVQ